MAKPDEISVPRSGRPSAWQHRGFRQLAGAWLFTNVADSALYLMLAVWVKELTGSDGAAALVFVMLGVPALLAPFFGQHADRMSRKKLLAMTNLTIALIVASLMLVESSSLLWLIYVVTFAYGCVGYLTASAQSGLIRDLLRDDELASGNGVLSTIDQGFRLLSPLLGTGLYVFAGPRAVVALTVVCFAISAMLLTRVEVDETEPATVADRGRYWEELTAGLRHLVRTRGLGSLTATLAIAFGAAGMANAAVFPAMEQGLGVDPSLLGAFVSIQGVGALTAGATASRLIGRLGERKTVALGMTLVAMGILPIASTSVIAVGVGLVLVGLGVPWILVAYTTLRQRLTPTQLQGRAAAASNMAINLPQTLATLGAAAVIGWIDYRILVLATVVVVAIAAALAGLRGSDVPMAAVDTGISER